MMRQAKVQQRLELGKGEQGGNQMFLRLRSNFKSEGKGYVRNIVEMGPLLKTIAALKREYQNNVGIFTRNGY